MRRGILLGALLAGLLSTGQAAPVPAGEAPDYFAKVGDVVITAEEYAETLRLSMRNRFYHGSPPEHEVAAFQREVGDTLIDRVLLVKEARRRDIEADETAVQTRLARDDQRYSNYAQWPEQRERVLGLLAERYRNELLVGRLEEAVRDVPPPTEQQLKRYYEQHPDKFTEPERFKVSMIMIKVDPSAPPPAWEAAKLEAAEVVQRLRAGEEFAELARAHSTDPSAGAGGDAGYLHRGMLGASAQEAIDAMQPGEVAEPIVFLEGVAILRLDDRRKAVLNPLSKVRERAASLWQRDEGESRWGQLKQELRRKTAITLNERLLAPLPAGPQGATPSD